METSECPEARVDDWDPGVARDPEAQRLLRRRPALIPAAVAEFLRHEAR
ncbi:MAG: hypothetical protein ACRDP7_28945 [Trebonia sp.]